MQRKIGQYVDAGTKVVWVLNPVKQQVVVYTGEGVVRVLSSDDILQGDPVLPGFECDVRTLFFD